MKYFLFLLMLCVGCVANKSVTKSNRKDSVSTVIHADYHSVIDTTVTRDKNIQIVDILFCDSIKGDEMILIGGQQYKGNIKSAKVTTISKSKINNGISIVDSSKLVNKKSSININTIDKEEPGQSPYKWLFIAIAILGVLGIIVFAYNKIKPLLDTLKPLEWIKELFEAKK